MRRTVCLLAALLVLPALGSDTPKEYDEKITLDELDGVWRATGFGQEEMTCRGGDFAVEVGIDIIRGKYRSDNSCNPRHLDMIPSNSIAAGHTFNFIYQIDGDTLRIAGFRVRRTERPRGFDDENAFIEIYKRVK